MNAIVPDDAPPSWTPGSVGSDTTPTPGACLVNACFADVVTVSSSSRWRSSSTPVAASLVEAAP